LTWIKLERKKVGHGPKPYNNSISTMNEAENIL